MPFVLHASIPACWALLDEEDQRADAAFVRMKAEEAVVPSLWWFEIRNILVVNERRNRITESDTGVFLRDLAGMRIRVDRQPEEGVLLKLARTHCLSVYDASYLELALREAIPLATLDAELTAAAVAECAPLIGTNG